MAAQSCTGSTHNQTGEESAGVDTTAVVEGAYGSLIAVSDVETIPDLPLQGILLAIPSESFQALVASAGGDSTRALGRQAFRVVLTDSLIGKYGVGYASADDSGDYDLRLPPGDYRLCLSLDTLDPEEARWPVRVRGCVPVTIPQGERVHVDVMWGEAGVTAQRR
jgi:hypothetical protein